MSLMVLLYNPLLYKYILHKKKEEPINAPNTVIGQGTIGIEILKKYEPEIDVDIDKPGSLLLQLLWQDENGKFGRQTEDKWVGFADWMKAKAILPENVEPKDAYTDAYSLK